MLQTLNTAPSYEEMEVPAKGRPFSQATPASLARPASTTATTMSELKIRRQKNAPPGVRALMASATADALNKGLIRDGNGAASKPGGSSKLRDLVAPSRQLPGKTQVCAFHTPKAVTYHAPTVMCPIMHLQ